MAKKLNREMLKKESERFTREVALNLKRLREKRNLTQEYIAECMGWDYSSSYGTLETGKKKLTFEEAIKIAEILDVDVMRILQPDQIRDGSSKIEEEQLPYGKPKSSSLQISVTLTGDLVHLNKQLSLLQRVNDLLAEESM